MTLNRVLQANVRLSEGGAAGVARALHDYVSGQGIHSEFIYGYGSGGRVSPLEGTYAATRLTPRSIALSNMVTFPLLGERSQLTTGRARSRLRHKLEGADVIHLHAMHSYFLNIEALVEELVAAGKPVIWTMHDEWLLTGRCAQPEGCTLWRTGCAKCPNLTAYPPSRVDHASTDWQKRRELLSRLQAELPTRVVACANWLASLAVEAGFENVSSITNSVDEEFWEHAGPGSPTDKRSGYLFLSRDMRDPKKVDEVFLAEVALISDLVIVGDHPPESLRGVTVPAIADRGGIAALMRSRSTLVFTSKVDYYPLTIAEALVAGLSVVALDSPAAREFQHFPGVTILAEKRDMIDFIRANPEGTAAPIRDVSEFAPEVMGSRYLGLYRELAL